MSSCNVRTNTPGNRRWPSGIGRLGLTCLSSVLALGMFAGTCQAQSASESEKQAAPSPYRAEALEAAGLTPSDMVNLPGAMWRVFISELRRVAEASPGLKAEEMRRDAEKENALAERGDIGLSLSASHTRYPDGSGSEAGGSFTNLEEYSEARLSIDLMHLLARRGSKIDSAEANVESVEYELELTTVQETSRLIEDAVTSWSMRYQRDALDNALSSIRDANRKLKLSESAGIPEITKATPSNVAEAIILGSEIRNQRKAISPMIPKIPNLPPDFSELPLTPPDGDQIYALALKNPGTQSLQAQARGFREEAQGLRGNGFEFSLYGGYVVQTLRDGPGTEEGVQYGATMTMPLGSSDMHKRKAAELKAHAAKMEALAAVRRSQRSLVDLRDEWAESVARLTQAQEHMRQQGRLLDSMKDRAGASRSGQAPEPWEVDVQSAKFWNAVANVWSFRAEWMKNVLTWALLDPDYLHQQARPANPEIIDSLCAPFASCSSDEI